MDFRRWGRSTTTGTVADVAPVSRLQKRVAWVIDTWFGSDAELFVLIIQSGSRHSRLETFLRAKNPRIRVERVSSSLDDDALHLALAAYGQCDLLVDTAPAHPTKPARLARLLFHTRRGGALLSHLGDVPRATAEQRRDYRRAVDRVIGLNASETRVWPNFIALKNARSALAVVRESQATEFLTAAPHVGRVVTVQPSRRVISAAHVTASDADHPQMLKHEWTTLELALREYVHCVTRPGQVVESGSVLMPDSLRQPWLRGNRNRWSESINRYFIDSDYEIPPEAVRATGPLPRRHGTYFHLDNEFRGHFGHTLTDVVSKLWAWPLVKERYPDAKALVHANKRGAPAMWERDVLEAAGVAGEDLVYEPGPVHVERLLTATPMFAQPGYAHPDMVGIWRGIGDRLVVRSTRHQTPLRIFIGRKLEKRSCRNSSEVERFFESMGFTVLFPEEYEIADQVSLFRDAEVVAGYAGSGMFGLVWAREPKKVIMLTSESYRAKNEWLIAGLAGHDLHIAWCRSEARWIDGGWEPGAESIQADFSFDFGREGEFVRELVAGWA
ncbi:glycosyltransferase 61 family protein [Nocardioides insulae]|uniref:glycosyltransferase 61 family protein n=1 Tax=Nocardioides insulae TaxID=394734 RepID=UPI000491E607|nr:glycosyltransferase 61 family protein [Nocardioides insulae]